MDKYLAVDLKDPGLIPSQIAFKEEMNQIVDNNKNNHSLVFGQWPQSKTYYLA